MKKLVLAGVLSLLVLTGCGKKEKIMCTKKENKNGFNIDSTLNVNLENSRFKGMTREDNIVIDEKLLIGKEKIIDAIKEQYKEFETQYKITPIIIETEKGSKVTMEMTTEQAKEFSGSNNDKATRKDVIETFKKQGFECK